MLVTEIVLASAVRRPPNSAGRCRRHRAGPNCARMLMACRGSRS